MFFDTALPALTAEADGHGRMELEAEFCRNFVCCGVTLRDLHELLEHHEDMHSPGPVSGDPSLEAYYGVGPPAIPPSVDTPPQSPCFCEVDALLTTQFPGRAAAHNPALDDRPLFPVAELDSPTAETLTRTPVIDSGYASPGGGARSLCATEDEVLGEENRGAAKSYSAYFGRVVQSPAANAGAAAAAAARGMKRRLDRRNGRDESAALAASPSVNLYLVTEKLSVGNSAFPSASSGLSYPSPVATPPAELACEVFTASADLDIRQGSPSPSHCRDPRVANSQAEELAESDTPSTTPSRQSSPDRLGRHRSSETNALCSASRSWSGSRSNKKQWPCPVLDCTRRFRLAGGLKYHIQNRHLGGSKASHRKRVAPRPPQDATPPGNEAS